MWHLIRGHEPQEEESVETYKVVERSNTKGRVVIDWPAVEQASAEGRAVEIPLNGALNTTMHAALHHGAQKRGLKAHVRSLKEEAAVEVWVESASAAAPAVPLKEGA
jgi:hypothetical protein